MKAIVADDSRVMRTIIERVVRSIGYEAIHASNGQEVLDLLEKGDPEISLILLDWNMPVMDGFEVLSHMQRQHLGRDIPVLMISTESEDVRVEQALRAGAWGYLPKPFTTEDLTAVIREALERADSRSS